MRCMFQCVVILTTGQRVFIVLNHARTQSPTDVRNRFRERFPDRNPPVTRTILRRWYPCQVHVQHELLADDFPRRAHFAEWFNVCSQHENFLDKFLIGDETGTYEFRPLQIANPMHKIPFDYVNASLGIGYC